MHNKTDFLRYKIKSVVVKHNFTDWLDGDAIIVIANKLCVNELMT